MGGTYTGAEAKASYPARRRGFECTPRRSANTKARTCTPAPKEGKAPLDRRESGRAECERSSVGLTVRRNMRRRPGLGQDLSTSGERFFKLAINRLETERLCARSGNEKDVHAVRQTLGRSPKCLAQAPLDAVAHHRVPRLLRHHQPNTGRAGVGSGDWRGLVRRSDERRHRPGRIVDRRRFFHGLTDAENYDKMSSRDPAPKLERAVELDFTSNAPLTTETLVARRRRRIGHFL